MGKKPKVEKLPPKVRKRGAGYTYRYDVPVIKDDGRPGRKQKDTKQYPTPQEAYNAGVIIEAQLIQGQYVDEATMLFTDWSPSMLEYHIKIKRLRPSTQDTYESLLGHANTYFASKKIKDLTHGHYQDFIFWLEENQKLAPSSITSIHALLSSMFKHAVKRGQIGVSPAAGAILPKEEESDEEREEVPNYLEKNQLLAVIQASKDMAAEANHPRDAFGWRQFSRILFILAHTGMRVGELGALEPTRIDTKKLTVKIASTLYDKRGLRNYETGPPKTRESRRTIDISRRVADVFDAQMRDLKTFKLMTGSKFYTEREFGFVMPTSHLPGYPINPAKINDMLELALEAAGLPRKLITAHGLRHTFTSLSAEAGVALIDIQKQLGHASDEMTRRVYLHVTETRRRANVDKLDALLGDF